MKIAIVNDVPMAVEAVRRVVANSGLYEIAWTAANGQEAVERCCQNTPDLILMDLIMPQVDGVEATRQIMTKCPCAILVVTASVSEHCARVFEAMGAGALDAVNTPVLEWPGSCKGAGDLLAKMETIRKLIGAETLAHRRSASPQDATTAKPDDRLIAIGASAGGPSALAKIISYLPASFRWSLVVVQHVDAQFAQALANWLDDQTPLRVRLAQEGESPTPGTILLAGGNHHLVFSGRRHLSYTRRPEDSSYCPSVDVFFRSIRQHWPGAVTAVLLTGMGRDGALGLRELKQAGHHTIAQNRESCAVYGMPKAAAELNAASEVLSLDQIGLRLRSLGAHSLRKAHV